MTTQNNLTIPEPLMPVYLWPEEQYARVDSHKETYPLSFEPNSTLIDQTNIKNKLELHEEMRKKLRLEQR